MTSLNEMFLETCLAFSSRPFLRHVGDDGAIRACSYVEGAARVAGVVRALQNVGVGRGDRVVAYLDAVVPSVFLVLGCFHLGAVPCFLSPRFSRATLRAVCTRVAPKAVLDADGLRGLDVDDPSLAVPFLQATLAPGGRDDLCLLQPTSGSTGSPKLVATPQRSFLCVADTLLQGVGAADPHSVLLVSTLTHGAGLCSLVAALMLGGELLVPRDHDIEARLEDVRRLEPTFAYTTPRVLLSLSRQRHDRSTHLFGQRMRHLLLTGAPANAELLERVQGEGVEVREVYASTEAGETLMTAPGQWKRGVVGPACAGVMLRLDDDGELLVRTPGQMLGYYDDPTSTAECHTADGFYRTGDFARIEANGDVRIIGRKRDLINTSEGTNIFPAPIEEKLRHLPWVEQAVLVGDQKPFVSAMLVVRHFEDAAELRERAITDIMAINGSLETIEKIGSVCLMRRPFSTSLYRTVGAGKISLDRRALERLCETMASKFVRTC